MRGFDRDLIRGGHYGQRSCEPHLTAEHMAAPTNAANVKKALANSEPSTHGTELPRPIRQGCQHSAERLTAPDRAVVSDALEMVVRNVHCRQRLSGRDN